VPSGAGFSVAAVFDLGHQPWLYPVDVLSPLGRAGTDEGALVRRLGLQCGHEQPRRRLAETRADPAEVFHAALLAHPDQQRAESAAAFGRPAADDDLIAAPAFGLHPA